MFVCVWFIFQSLLRYFFHVPSHSTFVKCKRARAALPHSKDETLNSTRHPGESSFEATIAKGLSFMLVGQGRFGWLLEMLISPPPPSHMWCHSEDPHNPQQLSRQYRVSCRGGYINLAEFNSITFRSTFQEARALIENYLAGTQKRVSLGNRHVDTDVHMHTHTHSVSLRLTLHVVVVTR